MTENFQIYIHPEIPSREMKLNHRDHCIFASCQEEEKERGETALRGWQNVIWCCYYYLGDMFNKFCHPDMLPFSINPP